MNVQMKFAPSILELPCDVLIPAALESQIHSGNAGNIKVPSGFNCVNFSILGIVCFDGLSGDICSRG